MVRIDFLGAPGVGKTTIYEKLIRSRKSQSDWMSPIEAKIFLANKYAAQDLSKIKNFISLMIFNIIFFKKIRPSIAARILSEKLKDEISDKVSSNKKLLEVVLNFSSSQYIDPWQRIRIVRNWYDIVYETYLFDISNYPGVVLFDESLSKKGLNLVSSLCRVEMGRNIENYFKNMPLPDAIIYCELDVEEAFLRVKMRNEKAPDGKRHQIARTHHYLDDKALYELVKFQLDMALIGADIVENRGVKVLNIKTSKSLVKCVEEVNLFVKSVRAQRQSP
jgi:hypothetical protein